MLHLDLGGNQFAGFRPWHKVGVTCTMDSDLGYVGLRREGAGSTSMTLCWADNALIQGPDRLKFIFLSQPILANGTAGTLDGLEAARVTPDPSGSETYFGIGDWLTAGGNADPDERLDILDRTIRIRRLIPDYQNNALDQVVVSDPSGRLFWRDATTLGGTDCDWEVTGAANVVTAHLAASPLGCPTQANNVGIGTANPTAKLEVIKTVNTGGGVEVGVDVRMATTGNSNFGGRGTTNLTQALQNTGWQGNATNGSRAWGLDGNAGSNSTGQSGGYSSARVVGVRGFADGNNIMPKDQVRGVWGIGLLDGQIGTRAWAGWFTGDVNIEFGDLYLNQMFQLSDETVKTNVQDLTNASALIAQLQPKSYTFDDQVHPELGLPTTFQRGLIAQELEQVLPELVTEVQRSDRLDSLGNVISPAYSLKAVNYIGLIPLLIANAQEQQVLIQQLRQDLDRCCNAPDIDATPRSMQDGSSDLENDLYKADSRLTIAPNPFQEQTIISYTLESNARVQLQVSSQSGLHIATLRDQQQEEGAYSLTWHTADLAPGTYIVTLFSDGAPVVKRAVKVK